MHIDLFENLPYGYARGVLEFIIKDRNGNIVDRIIDHNIIKIGAKEILSHRLPSSKVWDPEGGTGTGAWVDAGLYDIEEYAARYILFGASFDQNGVPLDVEDTRYYVLDVVTGKYVPIKLEPGAGVFYTENSITKYSPALINAIPISEPDRALKRVETISFEPTYQPAGTPYISKDVRAINNIVVLETTLKLDEYNGFGISDSDFFTITEVALAAGRTFDHVGHCELTPDKLFLQGSGGSSGDALLAHANGTDTITLDSSVSDPDLVKKGDQIKIVSAGGSVGSDDVLNQYNPYYLVLEKILGGLDMQLDRVPVTAANVPITGDIGVFRDTLKIFSHRILTSPLKKSSDFEIICRWRILMN